MTTTLPYVSPDELTDPTVQAPEYLDSIDFEFDGIEFRVRGVLHGLTGGANREYIDLVNRSIASATGFVMTEKSMKALYKGRIDKELDDWMPFRPWDAFRLGARLYFTPSLIWMLLTEGFRERLTKRDAFDASGRTDLDQLGGSPLFHRLEPYERRRLSGFPSPIRGVMRHLSLRCGLSTDDADRPNVPGRHWAFLNKIEEVALIPLRSVHMLAYARGYAVSRGIKVLDIFVGETHNTDMHALATNWQDFVEARGTPEITEFWKIVNSAEAAAAGKVSKLKHYGRYLRYIGSVMAPLAILAAVAVGGMAFVAGINL